MLEVEQIAIIGTGLLGASVGLGLKARGFTGRVVGVGRRVQTVERARSRGAIDHVETDLGRALTGAGLAIVAVPLGGFADIFQQMAGHDHSGLVITDVGSTKQSVIAAARAHLPTPNRFVGAHPMAGSEKQGPDAASADLFDAKPCIITPEPDTDPTALQRVESLWAGLGM